MVYRLLCRFFLIIFFGIFEYYIRYILEDIHIFCYFTILILFLFLISFIHESLKCLQNNVRKIWLALTAVGAQRLSNDNK